MQKPSKSGTFTPAKHGNQPNRASLNSGTRNSASQKVRDANAALFTLERKAGRLAHQRAVKVEGSR